MHMKTTGIKEGLQYAITARDAALRVFISFTVPGRKSMALYVVHQSRGQPNSKLTAKI